jgi:hypothetical protein
LLFLKSIQIKLRDHVDWLLEENPQNLRVAFSPRVEQDNISFQPANSWKKSDTIAAISKTGVAQELTAQLLLDQWMSKSTFLPDIKENRIGMRRQP